MKKNASFAMFAKKKGKVDKKKGNYSENKEISKKIGK